MNWKRAIEFSAPLLPIVTVLVAIYQADYGFDYNTLWQFEYAYWLLVPTTLLWLFVVIYLRPLTATGISPRQRFGLIAALVLSWVLDLIIFHRNYYSAPPNAPDPLVLGVCALIILAWGIRERLSKVAPSSTGTSCAACSYNLTGLAKGAVCPECGKASSAT